MKIPEYKFILVDMHVPLSHVIEFIQADSRNYNKVEEPLQIQAVKEKAGCLEWMAKPSKKVIEAAIMHNPKNIGRIRRPTKEIQLLAVGMLPEVIDYILDPCQEAKSLAALLS